MKVHRSRENFSQQMTFYVLTVRWQEVLQAFLEGKLIYDSSVLEKVENESQEGNMLTQVYLENSHQIASVSARENYNDGAAATCRSYVSAEPWEWWCALHVQKQWYHIQQAPAVLDEPHNALHHVASCRTDKGKKW